MPLESPCWSFCYLPDTGDPSHVIAGNSPGSSNGNFLVPRDGPPVGLTSRNARRITPQAFYLKYCEKCLELVLMDNTGASVVLSTETLSGARDGEVRHRRRVPQEIDFPAERIVDSGSLRLSEETGCERHPAKDAASHLSDEQAWQYFCQRLLAFPLTFAVYRHFRSRGCVECHHCCLRFESVPLAR